MKKLLALILMPFLFIGCNVRVNSPTSHDVLTKAAQAVEAISIGANDAAKTVIAEMEDNSDRQKVLDIITSIVKYDQKAKTIIEQLDKLQDVKSEDIASKIIPVLKEMRLAIDEGSLGIKNPESKKKAKLYLDLISISITTTQGFMEVYLGSSNNDRVN